MPLMQMEHTHPHLPAACASGDAHTHAHAHTPLPHPGSEGLKTQDWIPCPDPYDKSTPGNALAASQLSDTTQGAD